MGYVYIIGTLELAKIFIYLWSCVSINYVGGAHLVEAGDETNCISSPDLSDAYLVSFPDLLCTRVWERD